MLFQLANNTPQFEVFRLLNEELLYFIEQSVQPGEFRRELFTGGDVGQACWNNSKVNDFRTEKDLTRDKFEKLYTALQNEGEHIKVQLFETIRDNQNLQVFFNNPSPELLDFLSVDILKALKVITTHLYSSTKDLQAIINAANGVDINAHFQAFRDPNVNGSICKACGLRELAAFRAGVSDEDQWRADYDHQLCKSKYPIFAVHPDNLVPLCHVCNQDAKKSKDLFRCTEGNNRLAFYPYSEEAKSYVDIEIDALRDPEPQIRVVWTTQDVLEIEKLNTWDDVYDIRRLVEGRFIVLETLLEDEISPDSVELLESQIQLRAREPSRNTLKRKPWAFWEQKLFNALNQIDLAPFFEKSRFSAKQGREGGEYILGG